MARSRFLRDPGVSVQITARDDAMLKFLLRVKYARVEHFQRLFFSSYKTAAERCMKLFHAGLIDRTPLPASRGQAATIHTIAAAGINRLREIDMAIPREWRAKAASSAMLDHELAVSDVLVAFLSGAAKNGPSVAAYERANKHLLLTMPERVPGGSLKPDGAVVVDQNGERLFALIEVDRGTMSPTQMQEKFAVYREAALDGGCIEAALSALLSRHHVPLIDAAAGVRLLVTVPSVKRAVQLADVAVGLALKRFVMLAVHDEVVRSGVFAPVWKTAQDYLADSDGPASILVGESVHSG